MVVTVICAKNALPGECAQRRTLWVAPAATLPQQASRCSQNGGAAESPHRHQPLSCDLHPGTSRLQFYSITCNESIFKAARFDMSIAFQRLVPALRALHIMCRSLLLPFLFSSRLRRGAAVRCRCAAVAFSSC